MQHDQSSPTPMASKLISINIKDIEVGQRARPLDEVALDPLMESMRTIGFKTPITVREVLPTTDTAIPNRRLILVVGYHRLEAARRLGWSRIDAIVDTCDEVEARKWEIVENLHRA